MNDAGADRPETLRQQARDLLRRLSPEEARGLALELLSNEGPLRREENIEVDAGVRRRNLFQILMGNIPEHVYFKDPAGRFIQISASLARFLGLDDPEEAVGKTDFDFYPLEDARAYQRDEKELVRTGVPIFSKEERCVVACGEAKWFSTTKVLIKDHNGRSIGIVGMSRDVSDHRESETELREREQLFRQLAENINECFWLTEWSTRRVLYVSPAYETLYDQTCQRLYDDARSWADNIHPDDQARVVKAFEQLAEVGRYDEEYRVVHRDGSMRWVHDRAFPIRDDAGNVYRMAGITEDITARKRAEQIQRGRTRVLERLAAGAPLDQVLSILAETAEEARPGMLCSVLLLDDDKRHLRHGAAPSLPAFYVEAIDGLEIGPSVGACGTAAYTGRRVIIEDVMTHPFWKNYRELARGAGLRACWSEPIFSSTGETLGTFAMYYSESRAPDDSDLDFIRSSAFLAGIAIERKQLDLRLRLTDRLASIGTLAAGMVHDVNNVLMPIRCRLDALNWDSVSAELREFVESIHQAVEYLQHLVGGLRALARDTEGRDADNVTALHDWWAEVNPLMSSVVPERVVLDSDFPADLPLVGIAPHRLTQAVLNLIVNGVEATRDRGQLRVWAEAGGDRETVRLFVSDDGVGMTEEARIRAFDPFFTTKTRSASTGLGLWLVHNVVTSIGTTVNIDSGPERGTIVALTLPARNKSAVELEEGVRGRAAVSVRDSQTAAWITTLLESAGYEVRKAENGDPADSDVWITETTEENLAAAQRFSASPGRHRIVALGPAQPDWTDLSAAVVEDPKNLGTLKSVLMGLATPLSTLAYVADGPAGRPVVPATPPSSAGAD